MEVQETLHLTTAEYLTFKGFSGIFGTISKADDETKRGPTTLKGYNHVENVRQLHFGYARK